MNSSLFEEQKLPKAEQIKLANDAVQAVNALVAAQFGLEMEVLRAAVNAQAECYRALHHARSVPDGGPADG